jgi:NADH-quinone oxidoreductase subunit I
VNPDTGETLCTACDLCAMACPEKLIKVVSERDPVTKRKKMISFQYDMSRCMFCGLCVEACNSNCLELSQDYEMALYGREGMVLDRERLEKGQEPAVYSR